MAVIYYKRNFIWILQCNIPRDHVKMQCHIIQYMYAPSNHIYLVLLLQDNEIVCPSLPQISPVIERYALCTLYLLNVLGSTRCCSLVVKNLIIWAPTLAWHIGQLHAFKEDMNSYTYVHVVIHSETCTHNTWWARFALSSAAICAWNCCLSFANIPLCLSSSFCSKCSN